MRTFFQWWNALPDNLKDKFVKAQSNENNQISDKTYQINEVLKKFESTNDNMNFKKPTLEELKNWIETNQL
jgi:peptidoglycan hydrolase CwlO-like protein